MLWGMCRRCSRRHSGMKKKLEWLRGDGGAMWRKPMCLNDAMNDRSDRCQQKI